MGSHSFALPPFKPVRWSRSAHLQTLAGHFLPSPSPITAGQRIEISVPDEVPDSHQDKLGCLLWEGPTPLFFTLFHGLGGSTDSDYMRRAVKILHEQLGASVLLVNHRGQGFGRGLAKGIAHAGAVYDLNASLEWAYRRAPSAQHMAIGFSLSANMLLRFLGMSEYRTTAHHLRSVVAVSPPVDLRKCCLLLRQFQNKVYDLRFSKLLRQSAKLRQRDFPDLKIPSMHWNASVWDIDDIYIAPAAGLRNREFYYQTCSSLPHLAAISTPTLIIVAEDDPFIETSDFASASLSSSIQLSMTSEGGHMGFLESTGPLTYGRWLDRALLNIARQVLK